MLLFDFPVNIIKKTFKFLRDPFLAAYPFHQSRVFPLAIFHGGGRPPCPPTWMGGHHLWWGAGKILRKSQENHINCLLFARKVENLSLVGGMGDNQISDGGMGGQSGKSGQWRGTPMPPIRENPELPPGTKKSVWKRWGYRFSGGWGVQGLWRLGSVVKNKASPLNLWFSKNSNYSAPSSRRDLRFFSWKDFVKESGEK